MRMLLRAPDIIPNETAHARPQVLYGDSFAIKLRECEPREDLVIGVFLVSQNADGHGLPSNIACVASERQCRPAMLCAWAILSASLFSSPVSVIWPASGPVQDVRDRPSGAETIGLGKATLSVLKNAFNTVTQAPATVA